MPTWSLIVVADQEYKIPAGKDDLIALLNEEMMRGGRHPVYMRALTAAEPLL